MKTRIVLADDHEMIRAGLRSILQQQPGWEIVAEASDGLEAVRLARETSPNVMILDITMPHRNGIEAMREIAGQSPGTRVIGLSVHTERLFVLGMIRAGASGYLLKSSAARELVFAIESVLAGHPYITPKVTESLFATLIHEGVEAGEDVFRKLSSKEREVLQLLAEGRSNKEIASSMKISVKTVETHRAHIMDDLDIHTVAGLTKYAIREGLTPLEG